MDDIFEALAGIAAIVTLPIGILSAMFLSGTIAAVVFVVGWFLLVPLFGVLSEWNRSDAEELEQLVEVAEQAEQLKNDREPDERDTTSEDPLETLRERYARGEIDEREFEQKVDRLVATDEVPAWAVENDGSAEGDDAATDTAAERDVVREQTERK